ncbi:CNP1-like family protein [Robbsia sp. Bb-Pol-6]|uniref:CNP1-like family protein n=1 Tax=Robbsia betulipollinis TaxID=2981849 RepID=A0ABT3ZQV4_9BURK|nr:CNP1-like family protein [Robbsia betulipollinis]
MITLQRSIARLAGAATLVAALCALSDTAWSQAQLPPVDKSDSNGNSLVDMLFDRQSDWKEGPVDSLPALPSNGNLLPFDLSQRSGMKYMIDGKSVSVGADGVVRYTVVIDSPSGTRNIRYEGMHCASYRWRLYSGTNSEGTAWDNASTDWARIEDSALNGYHGTLYNNYFCDNKVPAKASNIVQNIRYGRSLRAQDYRN